jgi:hypothetical protein
MSSPTSPKEQSVATVDDLPVASAENRFELLVHDVSTGRCKFPIILSQSGRESAENTTVSRFITRIGSEERDHFCSLGYSWPGKSRHYLFYQGVPLNEQLCLIAYQIENGATIYSIASWGKSHPGEITYLPSTRILCTIPEPELRGLTLSQLRSVVIKILLRCEKEQLKSTNEKDSSTALLRPEQVTLYDLVEHFIIPQTMEHQCSYVELVAKGPQVPKYFVSPRGG